MSLSVPKSQFSQMIKDGAKHYEGLEEAILRNIEAVQEFARIVRSSYGPNGLNKLVINHLDKIFLTNDAATIVRELEVAHPAAKILVLASHQQEIESGDNTNLVIILAAEFLAKAQELLIMGLHQSAIIDGYELAAEKTAEILESICVNTVTDVKSFQEISAVVQSSLASKQHGIEKLLTKLVIDASTLVMPKKSASFNVDNIRVVKIMGASVHESRVVKGMVFGREPESYVKKVEKAKIAVFACALDNTLTETKGTILLHNADEMLKFSKEEEIQLEKKFKDLADAGVSVIVTGNGIGDMALHFINRYNLLSIKVLSKFDLRRLCRVVGARPVIQLGTPREEEYGYCDVVESVEIGGDRVTVFRQESEDSKAATVILRGGTRNLLDDIERAVDDGVNVVKALVKDGRVLAGAGATEIEISRRLHDYSLQCSDLNQYGINMFAEAFQVIPRILAENAGYKTNQVLAQLNKAHQSGQVLAGINIEDEKNPIFSVTEESETPIYDVYSIKKSAIALAAEAALTVLRVDQIIMSKAAGGPKPPKEKQNWDED